MLKTSDKTNYILFSTNFTARDYDIFFIICHYAKQINYSGFIQMSYSKFFDLMSGLNKTRFNDEIKSFSTKILGG